MTIVGRPLRVEHVRLEAWTAKFADQGMPADVVALLRYLFDEVFDGGNQTVTDGVVRGLGRGPRDFGECARRTAPTGVWDAR